MYDKKKSRKNVQLLEKRADSIASHGQVDAIMDNPDRSPDQRGRFARLETVKVEI
ncbi:MAG: hypothetical protein RH862_14325 [Leptospiraceae bacterium]